MSNFDIEDNEMEKLAEECWAMFEEVQHLTPVSKYAKMIQSELISNLRLYTPFIDDLYTLMFSTKIGKRLMQGLSIAVQDVLDAVKEQENLGILDMFWSKSKSIEFKIDCLFQEFKYLLDQILQRTQDFKKNIDKLTYYRIIAKRKNPYELIHNKAALDFCRKQIEFTNNEVKYDIFSDKLKQFLLDKKCSYNPKVLKFSLNKWIDRNSSGFLDPFEIEYFFDEIWCKPDRKEQFLSDINAFFSNPVSINEFSFTKQMLEEVGMERQFENFEIENLTSRALLTLDPDPQDLTEMLHSQLNLPLGSCIIIARCLNQQITQLKQQEGLKSECLLAQNRALSNTQFVRKRFVDDIDKNCDVKIFSDEVVNQCIKQVGGTKEQQVGDTTKKMAQGLGKAKLERINIGKITAYGWWEEDKLVSGSIEIEDMKDYVWFGGFNINMEIEGHFYRTQPADHEDQSFSYGFAQNQEPEPYIYDKQGKQTELEQRLDQATQLKKKTCKKIGKKSNNFDQGGWEFNKYYQTGGKLLPGVRGILMDEQRNALIKQQGSNKAESNPENQQYKVKLSELKNSPDYIQLKDFDMQFMDEEQNEQ